MKDLWKRLEDVFWVLISGLVCGFIFGKVMTYDTILTDCKVLGMTRYGNVPVGCRVGEAYK